jgi:hypothetical protein
MAQTTVPVYLSGKLGSMVYTGNRQGTAVRMLVTPKNPETAGQTAQRQRFSAAAKAWAAISNAAQLAWKTYAATLTNNLSSFNAFVRVNITAQLVGTTPPTLPPGSVSIAPVSFTGTPPLTATVTSGGAVTLTVTLAPFFGQVNAESIRPERAAVAAVVIPAHAVHAVRVAPEQGRGAGYRGRGCPPPASTPRLPQPDRPGWVMNCIADSITAP